MKLAIIRFAVIVAVAIALSGGFDNGSTNPIVTLPPSTGTIVGCVTDTSGRALRYANVIVVGTTFGTMTDSTGHYKIHGVPTGLCKVKAMMMGFAAVERDDIVVPFDDTTTVDFALVETIVPQTQEIVVTADKPMVEVRETRTRTALREQVEDMAVEDVLGDVALKAGTVKQGDKMHVRGGRGQEVVQFQTFADTPPQTPSGPPQRCVGPMNTESYDRVDENEFRDVVDRPFSTFSIDVDAASYANSRRFITGGHLPPPDAVRIEEFVNYFDYDYPDPTGEHPFAIVTELSGCPWNAEHQLLHIGLQGKRLEMDELPPSNLVFLIDVSGSMQPPNKLPLLIDSFLLLVDNLRDRDRVAIVVYAGSSGLVLPSTLGSQRGVIRGALERLRAGGSTAGAAGIQLAYQVAEENFIKGGNNRVILATDGDFNVGITDNGRLTRLIEEKRETGIFLSTLGFGMGNYKDDRLEMLADKGNGNYNYVDNIHEGRRVFVGQLAGTLFAIAKDVKIQLEFNPTKVQSYRLIGFENRMLRREDFANDKKDAGELGAGHSVTALYEIVPVQEAKTVAAATERGYKYVQMLIDPAAYETDEMLMVRLRYKRPDEDKSRLIEESFTSGAVDFTSASESMQFATAVAEFAMLLRDSKYAEGVTLENVVATAKGAMTHDPGGYRAEFVRLVNMCEPLMARDTEEE
jgi:Ca-activated chloride channel family protein